MDKIVEAIKSQSHYYKNIDGTDKLDVDGNRMVKKPLAESTIKNYTSTFNKVRDVLSEDRQLTFTNLSWLSDVDKNVKIFNNTGLSPNTLKTYYNVIVIVLKALGIQNDITNRYTALRDQLNKKYTDEQKTGLISDKQAPHFIKVETYMKMISDIEGLENKTLEQKQLLIILKLYLVLPARNELAQFTFTTKGDFNVLNRFDKTKNWAVRGNKLHLVVNEYKTNGTYGTYTEKLSSEFTNEINDLVTSRILVGKVGNYLFMNSDGGQLSKNNLSQILIRASNKYIEGSPNVSTTMIRKMLASDLSAVKNVKAKLLSERMKHSLGVHNMVYVKSHKPQ